MWGSTLNLLLTSIMLLELIESENEKKKENIRE
jgi:hypothetical protein